jgi:hypothetical protein
MASTGRSRIPRASLRPRTMAKRRRSTCGLTGTPRHGGGAVCGGGVGGARDVPRATATGGRGHRRSGTARGRTRERSALRLRLLWGGDRSWAKSLRPADPMRQLQRDPAAPRRIGYTAPQSRPRALCAPMGEIPCKSLRWDRGLLPFRRSSRVSLERLGELLEQAPAELLGALSSPVLGELLEHGPHASRPIHLARSTHAADPMHRPSDNNARPSPSMRWVAFERVLWEGRASCWTSTRRSAAQRARMNPASISSP